MWEWWYINGYFLFLPNLCKCAICGNDRSCPWIAWSSRVLNFLKQSPLGIIITRLLGQNSKTECFLTLKLKPSKLQLRAEQLCAFSVFRSTKFRAIPQRNEGEIKDRRGASRGTGSQLPLNWINFYGFFVFLFCLLGQKDIYFAPNTNCH